MNNIPRVSLEDSLYVLQLARETALTQNRQAQANRILPVVEELRNQVSSSTVSTTVQPSSGLMGQSDFQTLLNISQARMNQPQSVDATVNVAERNHLIGAMAEAQMTDVEIARQFSMTSEEVQMVLNMRQKNEYGKP